MDSITLFVLALGLSMDAFAVSISNSMCFSGLRRNEAALTSLSFGVFQGLMPVAGYFAGRAFADVVSAFDHWIAFALLALIGINMLREALSKDEDGETPDTDLSVKTMFIMAVATSIDALAVGISLAMAGVSNIFLAVLLIGATTFVLSAIGVKVGSVFGSKYEKKAEIVGGVILILLGVKILLEHLGVLA